MLWCEVHEAIHQGCRCSDLAFDLFEPIDIVWCDILDGCCSLRTVPPDDFMSLVPTHIELYKKTSQQPDHRLEARM